MNTKKGSTLLGGDTVSSAETNDEFRPNPNDSVNDPPTASAVKAADSEPAGGNRQPSFWLRCRNGGWPFLALLIVTLSVWARPVLANFATIRLSNPGDSESFAFYLSWNVHALTHFADPFFTPNLYAPGGMDLGNAISLPSVSVLVAPITAIFGGTAGYNTAFLLSVFLGAASVYLLAQALTGSKVGGTLAGALLVVSPYFTGHALGHLNLMWIFGLPFIAYLVVKFVKGELRGWWLSVGVAITIVVTLGASTELFVIEPIFAVIAFLVATAVIRRTLRGKLLRSLPFLAIGAGAGLVLGLPVIIAGLRTGIPDTVGNPPALYSSDLTNLFVPTRLLEFGGSSFEPLRQTWFGNDAENTAYLPVTLWLFIIGYALASRSRIAVGASLFAIVALIASFGPYLTVAGKSTVALPWSFLMQIKGLDHALPARFSAFVFIAVLIMVADAWAKRALPRWVSALAVASSFLLLLPSLGDARFPTAAPIAGYVSSGKFASEITLGENVLILPAGQWGPGMRWVDELDFTFGIPAGNAGGAALPDGLKDPVALALFVQDFAYPYQTELPAYLERVGVDLVVVDMSRPDWKASMDQSLPVEAVEEDGVWVYRLG